MTLSLEHDAGGVTFLAQMVFGGRHICSPGHEPVRVPAARLDEAASLEAKVIA